MEFIAFIKHCLEIVCLVILFIWGIGWLVSPAKSPISTLNGQYRRLTCLLEDAPPSSLRRQAYSLATPLMTPLACLLEDAPESSLHGQAYPLATPLMTPFACIWEQGWQSFYHQHLGKPQINYWEWRNFPFSEQLPRELSWLWSLPEPQGTPKTVLESLADKDQSFWNWETLHAFKHWHQQATQRLGLSTLKAIYQVCYNSPWERLQTIIYDSHLPLHRAIFDESSPWWKILNLKPFPPSSQVEQAYKSLMCVWHPDRTQHPLAHYVTARLNLAYEQYQLRQQRKAEKLDSVQQWFKSRFS
ncbi:heat shock protein DnaJ domain protein [Rippkaea orientalis PCC 8801]|uniref:Heat shock protein DnaJ domain protein n=1 Tax=Rippkaea orientalis (strain PCC 8801 / RF-1) TaxID=41431 RepID=B7JV09_RIPO1|nr:J domain-containing protein [Rippkaea orientalis]ACK66861.1 heat shock protein DnaJ domain protein [Rippkaea orientalis PCC 8801]